MLIEPLSAAHDREAFDCGVESLNLYLKRYARQNARNNYGVTYVAVDTPGTMQIAGYYTLANSAVACAVLPEKHLPPYPIPATLLGRLAVDQSRQGQGLGRDLLIDALQRALRLSASSGSYAVEVAALDETARAFYLRFGFQPLIDDPLHLYLPMKTLQKMTLAPAN